MENLSDKAAEIAKRAAVMMKALGTDKVTETEAFFDGNGTVVDQLTVTVEINHPKPATKP